MKLKKALLLSLLSLTLTGCAGGNATETPGTTDNGGEIDNSGTTEGNGSTDSDGSTDGDGKTDGDGDGNTDGGGDDNSGTDPTPTPDPEPEEPDPYQSGWPTAVVDDLLKYCGNQVIPYLNLGKNDYVSSTYTVSTAAATDPYLKIEGLQEYDTTFIAEAINTYKTEGWTVSGSGFGFEATKDKLKVKLVVDTSSLGIYLAVYYDETYDPTSVSDWNDEIKGLISTYLDKHTLPYIYLGTANPYYTTWTTSTSSGFVYGRGWNDEMVDLAYATLTQAGWTGSIGSNSSYNCKTLSMSYTDPVDECKISISLSNYNANNPRARLQISIVEGFDPSRFTSWNADVADAFSYDLDGHELPLIYLGSTNPSVSWVTGTQKLTITGGFFDSRVLTIAETAFTNDADANGNSYWSISKGTDSYGNTIEAFREFSDGCTMSVVVGGSSTTATSNKAKIVVNFAPKLTVSSDKTTWSDDVKAKLSAPLETGSTATILDGHDLPYVYLNNPMETATVTVGSARKIAITGGLYNANVIYKAISVYTADGWTVEKLTSSYGIGFKAVKQFYHTDDKSDNPCEITATIAAPSSTTTSPYTKYTMTLNAYISEGYGTHEYTAWGSTIQSNLNSYYNNFTLPVIYLGSNHVSCSYSNSLMTMYGGGWSDQIFTDAETVLKADGGWTITSADMSAKTPELTAVKTDDTGADVTITLSSYYSASYYYKRPMMTVKYSGAYEEPENGAWKADTIKLFTTNFGTDMTAGTNVVPYTYLHIENGKETSSYTASYKRVSITGGLWDDRVLATAETNYKAAGWTTSIGKGSYSKRFEAVKENADGSHFRACIYRSSNADNAKVSMYIFYDPAATTYNTTGTWDTDTESKMQSAFGGNAIPYLDLGQTKDWTTENTIGANTDYFTLKTAAVIPNGNMYKIVDVLKADGYSASMNYFPNITYGPMITATKTVNGSVIHLLVKNYGTSGSGILGWYDDDYSTKIPTDYTYANEYADKAEDILGVSLPNIYLGLEQLTMASSYTNGTFNLKGKGYSSTLISDAEAAFKADTVNKWTLTYADNNKFTASGKVLCAMTTNSAGETVSVYVYQHLAKLTYSSTSVVTYPFLDAYVG